MQGCTHPYINQTNAGLKTSIGVENINGCGGGSGSGSNSENNENI